MGKIVIRPTSTKGVVILGNTKSPPPTVTLANGQTITGQFLNSENGLHQFKLGIGPQEATGMVVNYEGHTSPQLDFRGGQAEYRTEGGTVSSLNQAPNKAMYGGAGGGGAYGPTPFGQYGMGPANLTGMFPSPFLTNYQPIQSAPYKFTDAKKFAEKFGAFNRGELNKNYQQSKNFALDTLGTELQSLQGYVPAASALKRQETAADNVFNQQQRTQQLDSTLPEVRGQLQSQGQRAESYANGRIPDPVQDRAYELGVRSGAADIAAAGGFGARSSVARKASDLMSARERLGIAQAGENLLTGNINQRAQIELAPTEYSNAGGQVNVMPSTSFSQLQNSNFGQINQNTLIAPSTAYQGDIQQNQFTTAQEQQTRTFNASNTLQNDQFNATNQNTFALQKFGYQAGLAGAYAGAAQTNLNTGIAVDQQNAATAAFSDAQNKAQNSAQVSAITGLLGAVAAAVASGGASLGLSGGGGGDITGALSGADAGGDIASGVLGSLGGLGKWSRMGASSTGASSEGQGAPPTMAALSASSGPVLRSAGISNTPSQGAVSNGVDTDGNPVYSSPALLGNNDITTGSQLVSQTRDLVQPFNVLNDADQTKFTAIQDNVSNPEVIKSLDAAAQKKDATQFVSKATSAVQDSSPTAKHTASQLYKSWSVMSDSQKSLGLAALGVSSYKTSDGQSLGSKEVKPGLTVAKSLELNNAGYNSYSLAKNWDQLKSLQKDSAIPGGTTQLASTAKALGLLGYGPQGAVVPRIDQKTLTDLNATPVSQYGVGALSIPSGKAVPAGYTTVTKTKDGNTVIVPTANAKSVAPGTHDIVNGGAPISAATQGVYAAWNKTDKAPSEPNGALGGSAMVSGIQNLKDTNPVLFNKMIASASDIRDLNSIGGVSKLGGSVLAKLVTGSSDKAAAQKGDKFRQEALNGIDSKTLDQGSYNSLMKNQRALYAREGIKSQSDGYQLANQAYAEGRINDVELVTAQHAIDMIFGQDTYRDFRRMDVEDSTTSITSTNAPLKESRLPAFIANRKGGANANRPIFNSNKASNSAVFSGAR